MACQKHEATYSPRYRRCSGAAKEYRRNQLRRSPALDQRLSACLLKATAIPGRRFGVGHFHGFTEEQCHRLVGVQDPQRCVHAIVDVQALFGRVCNQATRHPAAQWLAASDCLLKKRHAIASMNQGERFQAAGVIPDAVVVCLPFW